MKSSLKTFLTGKNPYIDQNAKLKYSGWLNFETDAEPSDAYFIYDNKTWLIDVLDDGTAITYTVTLS